MRVAIYARVSTDDRGQDPENQLRQLREWCERSGHALIREYVDHASGRKGADGRKQFAAMIADAHRRQFDMVAVWALDRFSREGMVATIGHLQRLASYGVSFHSYSEPALSSDNEMTRDIVLAVLAALAKQEARRISERTKAGMERAKAAGVRIGRPALDQATQAAIHEALAGGASRYTVAKVLRLDPHTVAKYAACLPLRFNT